MSPMSFPHQTSLCPSPGKKWWRGREWRKLPSEFFQEDQKSNYSAGWELQFSEQGGSTNDEDDQQVPGSELKTDDAAVLSTASGFLTPDDDPEDPNGLNFRDIDDVPDEGLDQMIWKRGEEGITLDGGVVPDELGIFFFLKLI